MATISIAATGVATRGKTISTGDTTRLLNAFRGIYGQVSNGSGGMRDRTDQEIFDRFADGIFDDMRVLVRRTEDDVDAAAAKAANTDIVFT